jgi:DNA-binding MarR family transcriptional regulator
MHFKLKEEGDAKVETQNENKKDNKYEYSKILLTDLKSKYIYIPLSLITDKELDNKRVGTFSYLRVHCGLNDTVGFTIPDMVEWCGMKPNKREGKTNDKFLSIVEDLIHRGYFTSLTDKSKSAYIKCKLNMEYYYERCSKGYAVIYLDELQKILSYKNLQGNSINNATILLVFSYFRNRIIRRPNELKPEERTIEGAIQRRTRLPDAFDGNINDIAKELGIHKQTLTKIIDILERDLKLIVTDRAYRVKNDDNEFRTLPTIFANTYKREDKYLLVTGEDYARTEIELKAENMKQHYQDYKIDKRKRKNKVERGET